MPTPIVVLSQSISASQHAVVYATLLAKTMGVPVRMLQIAPATASASETTDDLLIRNPATYLKPPIVSGIAESEAIDFKEIAPALVKQDALLVVILRPATAKRPVGWLAPAVWSLLNIVRPPLLLVPDGTGVQALPLRLALVADGDPFTLVHGQRAMHALLLTLPIQITVFHAPVPPSTSSPTDALQTLLACGLAARYLSTATIFEVQANSIEDGILAGMRQIGADLLVLIIRKTRLEAADFKTGPMAALLQLSPVPVLLLLAADTAI